MERLAILVATLLAVGAVRENGVVKKAALVHDAWRCAREQAFNFVRVQFPWGARLLPFLSADPGAQVADEHRPGWEALILQVSRTLAA